MQPVRRTDVRRQHTSKAGVEPPKPVPATASGQKPEAGSSKGAGAQPAAVTAEDARESDDGGDAPLLAARPPCAAPPADAAFVVEASQPASLLPHEHLTALHMCTTSLTLKPATPQYLPPALA